MSTPKTAAVPRSPSPGQSASLHMALDCSPPRQDITASGWQSATIGTATNPTTVFDGETAFICAVGENIYYTDDDFHYLFTTSNGDFAQLTVRLTDWDGGAHTWARTGLMLRTSTADDAVNYMLRVRTTTGDGLHLSAQWRAQSGASTEIAGAAYPNRPVWLRLTRQGDQVTAAYASYGVNWTVLDTRTLPNLTNDALIGIATTSRNGVDTAQAQYDSITYADTPPTGPRSYVTDPFSRTLSDGWGELVPGGPYHTKGSAFAVDGAVGTMTFTTTNSLGSAVLSEIVLQDTDTRLKVQMDAAPVDARQSAYLLFRFGTGFFYRANVHAYPDTTEMVFTKWEDGASPEITNIGTPVALPGLAVDAPFWVRAVVAGSNPTVLRMKVWAVGQPEPAGWQITETDSTAGLQDAGNAGMQVYNAASSQQTNLSYRFDDWQVTSPSEFLPAQVAAGGAHSCRVAADGTASCWGDNTFGQAPAAVAGTQGITTTWLHLSAGAAHTCGVQTDGTAICWGDDTFGQSTAPTADRLTQISAGWRHSCGRDGTSQVTCWGDDTFGQATVPAGDYRSVSAGWRHSCGVQTDGTLRCWGDDTYGQVSEPTAAMERFVSVSVGRDTTCARQSDSTLQCWGRRTFGETQPPETGAWVQVALGRDHACGLTEAGTVQCWGSRFAGQHTVPPDTTYTSLSAGALHTCGVRTDGGIDCWGANDDGQATPPVSE